MEQLGQADEGEAKLGQVFKLRCPPHPRYCQVCEEDEEDKARRRQGRCAKKMRDASGGAKDAMGNGSGGVDQRPCTKKMRDASG